MALGEFSTDGYKGKDTYTNWTFFIMASFLVIVVFMNMLIAIMTETFSSVQLIKEENAIMEQASLIADHIWILDIEEEFKDMRHIIVLTPDVSQSNVEMELSDYI